MADNTTVYPKDYIAYWYSNSHNFHSSYINQHLRNIEETFKKRADNFKEQEFAARTKVLSSGYSQGVNTLISVLADENATKSGSLLEKVLCVDIPDGDVIMQQQAQEIFDKFLGNDDIVSVWQKVRNAYAGLKNFENEVDRSIDNYTNKLEHLVSSIVESKGQDTNLLEKYKNMIFQSIVTQMNNSDTMREAAEKAAKNLGVSGKVSDTQLAGSLIINSFLTRDPIVDAMYENLQTDDADLQRMDAEMGTGLRRTLAMIVALPSMDGLLGNTIDKFIVKHKNKKDEPLKGDDLGSQIWNALYDKNINAFIYMVGATAYEAIVKSLFNELGKVYGNLPDETFINSFKTSGSGHYTANILGINIDEDIEFKADPKLEKFFAASGQTEVRMTGATNKADVAINDYGISLKTIPSRDMSIDKKTGKKSIKLLSGSPLSTLIAREAGLGPQGIYNTLQLAMGHGVDEEGGWGNYKGATEENLEQMWIQWKDALLSLAFINALSGNEGTSAKIAYHMVYEDRIYHMTDIIDMYMNSNFGEDEEKFGSLTVDSGANGFDRDTYLNYWNSRPGFQKPRRRGKKKAIARSEKFLADAQKIMYDTKIKILINAAMLPKL